MFRFYEYRQKWFIRTRINPSKYKDYGAVVCRIYGILRPTFVRKNPPTPSTLLLQSPTSSWKPIDSSHTFGLSPSKTVVFSRPAGSEE